MTAGRPRSPEYRAWVAMRYRTRNAWKGHPQLRPYVGVWVCERWSSFDLFIADMGPRPSSEHSIDRIDPYGGYEPTNCRWATRTEQNRNLKTNVTRGHSAAELCALSGVKETTFWNRRRRGLPMEICLMPGRLHMRKNQGLQQ